MTDATPRGGARGATITSWSALVVLPLLAAASILAWPSAFDADTTQSHPHGWAYVLTVEDQQPKSYGPFANLGACDLSLTTAMSDLNQRLPGLYVASPCAATSSPATASS